MADGVLARQGYEAGLLAFIEGGAWWLHLYTNDIELTAATVAADLVEPEFIGYAPAELRKWTKPALRAASAKSWADPVYYEYQGGPEPDPIVGAYITAGIAGPLVWAWKSPGGAFPLGAAFPVLAVVPALEYPPPCD